MKTKSEDAGLAALLGRFLSVVGIVGVVVISVIALTVAAVAVHHGWWPWQ